jgi:phage tail tape-measure protein
MNLRYFLLVLSLVAVEVNAGNSTLDAAIGGGIGGAAGAAIGNEVGGRDGAIVGGALGAAVGTAVNTDRDSRRAAPPVEPRYEYSSPRGGHPSQHCPPGQAKKGRC